MRISLPTLLCTVTVACSPPESGDPTGPVDTDTGAASTTTGTPTTGTPTTPTTTGTTLDIVTTTGTSEQTTSTDATDTCGFLCDTSDSSCGQVAGQGGELSARCTSVCDLFLQDCSEGEKCSPWAESSSAWDAQKCVPVNGDRRPGETCTVMDGSMSGLDDCIVGALCWDVEGDVGTCIAMCTGSAEDPVCADEATLCAVFNDGVLNLCLPRCDPLASECPDGQVCHPNADHFVCVPDVSGAAGQAGDPCEVIGACDEGLACVSPSASPACDPQIDGCCQPYCSFPDGICADPAQTCQQWFDPMNLPENDPRLGIGVCTVPP